MPRNTCQLQRFWAQLLNWFLSGVFLSLPSSGLNAPWAELPRWLDGWSKKDSFVFACVNWAIIWETQKDRMSKLLAEEDLMANYLLIVPWCEHWACLVICFERGDNSDCSSHSERHRFAMYSTNGYRSIGISDPKMKLATPDEICAKNKRVQVLSESLVASLRLHSALLDQRLAYRDRERQMRTQFKPNRREKSRSKFHCIAYHKVMNSPNWRL